MKRCNRKTGLSLLALLTVCTTLVQAQELENLMAYASPSATLTANSGSGHTDEASNLTITRADEVIISSYFTLSGKTLKPYMMVNNNSMSFDARQLDLEENVSIRFNNDNIEYVTDGKLYRFPIRNIDQYLNNTPNCLLKSKIVVNTGTVKVDEEKIDEISVYLDHEDHISFVRIGEQEFYLKK
jgi:hypothetical protein